jgi:hypothetical protein
MKGSQISDAKLMDHALKEFQEKARKKFLSGIKEHNLNGDKGMINMHLKQHIDSAKDEVMDLWFYLCGMQEWLTGDIENREGDPE